MRRVQTTLNVRTPDGRDVVVDTDDNTTFDIPGFEDANINQVKHHLEVEKMSKTQGNVIAPDELVAQYGADTVRAYLMFAFRWEQGGPWDSQGIQGPARWLEDVWNIVTSGAPGGTPDPIAERALRRRTHQAILMALRNDLKAAKNAANVGAAVWDKTIETMLILMAPFTPFIAEELWIETGHAYSIHDQPWPEFDPEIAAEDVITLVVQINGKVRDRIQVPADISEEDAIRLALASEGAQRHMDGKEPRKVIYIGQRGMVNIVV
jgi:leucyl-tRNA synthetase